jgi:flagellar hook assembly protein FlgD
LDGINTSKNPGSKPDEEGVVHAIYPNPFSDEVTIQLLINQLCRLKIGIIDPSGSEVVVLADEKKTPGKYTITWNGKDAIGNKVSAGLYYCAIRSDEKQNIIKIMILGN